MLWENVKVCFFQLYLDLTTAGIFLTEKPMGKNIEGKFGADILEKIVKDHRSNKYLVYLY